MRKYIEITALTAWLKTLPAERLQNEFAVSDGDGEPSDPFQLSTYLSESAEKFYEWLVSQGLYERNRCIVYDPDNFDNIATATAAIVADYDHDDEELFKLGVLPPYCDANGVRSDAMPWSKWDLGGDDDVDYNGGYITIILDILIAYEAREQQACVSPTE